MLDFIGVKAVLKALVLPPTGLLLVALLGLVLLRRRPRLGRALAFAGVGGLFVLSMPIVAVGLLRALDDTPPLDPEVARTAQAIVILGGGVRRHALEYGGDTLSRLTLERVRYGARVARLVDLPVLVTGGSVYGGTTEATLMRDALEHEFGVKVRWLEAQSRTTHENARFTSRTLRAAGIERVVLVAHSFDMPRAKAEFAANGSVVVPAPTGLPRGESDSPLDFMPSLSALQGSYYAIYEMLALAVMRVSRAGG